MELFLRMIRQGGCTADTSTLNQHPFGTSFFTIHVSCAVRVQRPSSAMPRAHYSSSECPRPGYFPHHRIFMNPKITCGLFVFEKPKP